MKELIEKKIAEYTEQHNKNVEQNVLLTGAIQALQQLLTEIPEEVDDQREGKEL